jgi:hypothetical protein
MLTTPSLTNVLSIPCASTFSRDKDPSTPTELKVLAAGIIKAEHEHYLLIISQ